MPELPEVESIAASLRRRAVGLTIAGTELLWPKLLRGGAAGLASLRGKAVTAVGRRGKHLLLVCGDRVLVFHLRMTGRFLWARSGAPLGKHVRFVLRFHGSGRELRFEDARKFGFLRCVPGAELASCVELAGLGPEPMEISPEQFTARLGGRKGRVKSVLLDQAFVAGIGNIYADEMLFDAGIHPRASAARLSGPRTQKLWASMRGVLGRALAAGGSTVRDYRDADGEAGSFQNEHRVYGRAKQPCPRCGRPIKRETIGGRGTHYCPSCQRR